MTCRRLDYHLDSGPTTFAGTCRGVNLCAVPFGTDTVPSSDILLSQSKICYVALTSLYGKGQVIATSYRSCGPWTLDFLNRRGPYAEYKTTRHPGRCPFPILFPPGGAPTPVSPFQCRDAWRRAGNHRMPDGTQGIAVDILGILGTAWWCPRAGHGVSAGPAPQP